MKQRIRSPTDEREKKENDKPRRLHNKENERRSQNRSKTSRHKTACFSFGFLSEGSKKTENSESAVLVNNNMAFFQSSITVLQTLVIAIGAGLGLWGGINLMEGYGNDNPGAKSQGIKQLMAGGGIALIGGVLVPVLGTLFG